MKTCNRCQIAKPLDDFYRNKGMADGRLKQCKDCTKKSQARYFATDHGRGVARTGQAAWRKKHRERVNQQAKARRRKDLAKARRVGRDSVARAYARDPAAIKARARANYHANPEKYAAHRRVRDAVSRGELQVPDVCEDCLQAPGTARDGRRLIQAHHDDYAKPLEVRWLCPPCHKAAHTTLDDAATSA